MEELKDFFPCKSKKSMLVFVYIGGQYTHRSNQWLWILNERGSDHEKLITHIHVSMRISTEHFMNWKEFYTQVPFLNNRRVYYCTNQWPSFKNQLIRTRNSEIFFYNKYCIVIYSVPMLSMSMMCLSDRFCHTLSLVIDLSHSDWSRYLELWIWL